MQVTTAALSSWAQCHVSCPKGITSESLLPSHTPLLQGWLDLHLYHRGSGLFFTPKLEERVPWHAPLCVPWETVCWNMAGVYMNTNGRPCGKGHMNSLDVSSVSWTSGCFGNYPKLSQHQEGLSTVRYFPLGFCFFFVFFLFVCFVSKHKAQRGKRLTQSHRADGHQVGTENSGSWIRASTICPHWSPWSQLSLSLPHPVSLRLPPGLMSQPDLIHLRGDISSSVHCQHLAAELLEGFGLEGSALCRQMQKMPSVVSWFPPETHDSKGESSSSFPSMSGTKGREIDSHRACPGYSTNVTKVVFVHARGLRALIIFL